MTNRNHVVALVTQPADGDALKRIAHAAVRRGEPDKAVRWLLRCLAGGTASFDVEEIEFLIARGHMAVAAQALRLGLHGRPDRADLVNLLAGFLEGLVRSGSSAAAADRSIVDDGSGLFRRGVASVAAGCLDEADVLFRASLAMDPGSYACRAALAIIVLLVTQIERLRLVLSGAGVVEITRRDGVLRIEPADRRSRGCVLFAYYADVILLPAGHPTFAAHTNRWESRCIARTLIGLGYAIDAIEFGGAFPARAESYDAIFCLHDGLARIADRISPHTRKIMLLTGSSPDYQNRREQGRIAALLARREQTCAPRRQIGEADRELKSLALADHCLLQGNAYTRGSYAPEVQAKTILIPVSGAVDGRLPAARSEPPKGRHVLWHFGIGAVHKGLDLAVEVFLRNPTWTLEVVSQACYEPDFLAIYGDLIRTRGNIRLHGFQFPSSRRFQEIVASCVAFLGTSCSEGTSTACITCLQHGLVPVVTRDCGLDLDGFGITIENDSVEAIEQAVGRVLGLEADELARQGRLARLHAETSFSRRAFATAVSQFFDRALVDRGQA